MSEADPRLHEALEDLQGYLADTLPPLLVADAVETLLDYPPALTAEQLRSWAFFQYQGRRGATPFADLLYHGIKKIQQLEVHHLVEEERFARFLDLLATQLLAACQSDERERLASLLRHLRESVGGATALVDHLHRPAGGTADAAARHEGGAEGASSSRLDPEEVRGLHRFTLALERALSGLVAGGPGADAMAQQLLVLATSGAHNSADLETRMAKLREAGVGPASATDLLRSLVGAVPDWLVTLPTGRSAPSSGSLEAVRRAVRLTGGREGSGERWKELLAAAAEQFNSRAFGRCVALLDLAGRMVRDGEVDPRFADIALGNAHEAFEVTVMLEAAADRQQWPVLHRLAELHPAWSVRELLEALVFQPDAKKRKLLIALLEVWGAEARPEVIDRLEISVAERSRDPNLWWYQRNLVFLMHRLPREANANAARELTLVAPFSTLAHHPSFQREAFLLLSQLPGHLGSATLVQRLAEAERALDGSPPPLPAEEIWKLMNALAVALVRCGAPSARRALLDHALARRPRDGESLTRVRALARIDLASDHETVSRLLGALRDLAPGKLLGFVFGRRTEELAHLVSALSGTSTPEVRSAVAELTDRFPELEVSPPEPTGAGSAPGTSERSHLARGAGEVEESLEEAAPAAPRGSMAGDLEVFGLAGLLQSFQQSATTGRLLLRDAKGQDYAELVLHAGRLAACRAGLLSDGAAFYQLFEVPTSGTFEFVRSEPARGLEPAAREITGLLLEAMRRYDELQRLRAVVPDALRLRPTGSRPSAPEGETEGEFVRRVWELARGGASTVDCEASVAVDSYRIRSLLAHWLDEGALAPMS